MQRVTRPTAAAVLPAAPSPPGTPGFFTGGDPVANLPATVPGYEWFNGVQEELIAAITHAGQVASGSDLTQLRRAISRMGGAAYRAVTANVTLTADDAGMVVVAPAAGNVVLTLPAANAAGGRSIEFMIARQSPAAQTCVVQAAGADFIESGTSFDIATGRRLLLKSDGNSVWRIIVGAEGAGGATVLTSSATLLGGDAGLVSVDATAGNITITLPAASALSARALPLCFVRTDATANTVTIQRAGANLIEGQATIPLAVGERLELLSDGASAWRVRSRSGPIQRMQAFTANGSFTVPQGVYRIKVRLWGGGGGGGAATAAAGSGSGGGGGGFAEGVFDVTPNQVLTATVGAAGAAGVGGNGGAGGSTSLGSLLSATGGGGGLASAGAQPTSGPGGAGTGGAYQIGGQPGQPGVQLGGTPFGGAGGNPFGSTGAPASPGLGGGGTRAGGGSGGANNNAGGAGGAGLIIVEW